MSTVEPVFGTLINFLGMRKVNTLGKAGAHKCMLMAATAFNLKKLLKYAKKTIKTMSNHLEIQTTTKKNIRNLFFVVIDFMRSPIKPLIPIFHQE
jgi:hypothetical protein